MALFSKYLSNVFFSIESFCNWSLIVIFLSHSLLVHRATCLMCCILRHLNLLLCLSSRIKLSVSYNNASYKTVPYLTESLSFPICPAWPQLKFVLIVWFTLKYALLSLVICLIRTLMCSGFYSFEVSFSFWCTTSPLKLHYLFLPYIHIHWILIAFANSPIALYNSL